MTYKILTYDAIDRTEWGRLVRESETGTWFQSPEAYSFYESLPDLFKPFVVGVAVERVNELTNERKLRGVCVGYVTKEKNPIKQYFTRRAIILGGPVIADDATCEEVKFLMEAVRQRLQILDFRFKILNSPIYIETRNFNDYSRWRVAFEQCGGHPRRRPLLPFRWKDAPGFGYKKHLNFHIDCTDKEAMWERLSEVRRRQVKKAISNGVEIKSEGISEAEIREWYQILKDLYAKKVKTPLFPLEFFLSFYRKDIGKYLLVKYRGKVIGGMMIVVKELENERVSELGKGERGCVYEWYICGLDNEYREQYPSVMATWAAMEYANEHGLARFDVMGAGVPGVPYGVRDFKAEFGGELVELGRFLCVCKPWLYRLGTFVVKLMKRKKQIKPF